METENQTFWGKYKVVVLLLIILSIATAFRFAFLTSIPPGIHPDAAANALDAWTSYQNHDRPVFYPGNNGREGMFINFISYSFQLFGPGFVAYKLPGCIIGVLSVLGMFFLGWEVSRKKYVGLLASFSMAISFWMVVFERIGFRAVFSVFCVTWISYFFLKSLRTNKWYDYSLAGIFLGLGLNSYISFRMLPFAVIAGLIYKIFLSRKIDFVPIGKAVWSHKKFILIIFFSAVVFAPLVLYLLHNSEFLMARSSEVSVFNQPHTLKLLFESTLANLSMFNFFGDPNWRHNFSTLPALDAFQGILFIFGIIITLGYIFKKQSQSEEVVNLKTNYLYILTVFAVMVIPAAITYSPGGIPHSLRIIDTAPSMFVLIAIAFFALYEKIKPCFLENRKFLTAAVIIVLSYLMINNAVLYFARWGLSNEVAHEYSQDFTNLSQFINQQAGQGNKVLVSLHSIEVDYFTLNNPNVIKVSDLSLDDVGNNNPNFIIFTNFGADASDTNNTNILTAQGWKEASIDLGQGGHPIKILSRN
jgi:4-amino-4-deoxy-L-arabinose transferase-like glycosyltransferase